LTIKKKLNQFNNSNNNSNNNHSNSNNQQQQQQPTMMKGAFVLKMKTHEWRMCVVKQVPELSASNFMLFGQSMKDKTTFQMEFNPCQESMLIQHMANMGNMGMANMGTGNMGAEIRLVLVTDAPAVSCIGSLWSSKGLEMYRRELYTVKSLIDSLHQDMNMLNLSPQLQQARQQQQQQQHQQAQQAQQSRHSMQTRSKAS
jgi:hypothetical protein